MSFFLFYEFAIGGPTGSYVAKNALDKSQTRLSARVKCCCVLRAGRQINIFHLYSCCVVLVQASYFVDDGIRCACVKCLV